MKKLYVGRVQSDGSQSRPAEKIVILDCSGSMSSHFGDLQRFLNSFYDQYGKFTLFRFGSSVKQDTINTRSNIPSVSSLGSTNVAEVINRVERYISAKGSSAPISILWVSDGQPNDFGAALRSIERLKDQFYHRNITIVSCNYGIYADTRIATALASVTEGSVFKGISPNQLSSQCEGIANEMACQQSYGLVAGDHGLDCQPVDKDRAHTECLEDGFFTANAVGLLAPIITPSQGQMVYLGVTQPINNQYVSWREISDGDIKLIESLVARVRSFLVGAKIRQVNLSMFSKNALAQALMLEQVVSQMFSNQEAVLERQTVVDISHESGLAILRGKIKDSRRERAQAFSKKFASKQDKRILTLFAQLQTIIQRALELDSFASLDKVNELFKPLSSAAASRISKLDDQPLSKFVGTLADNLPTFQAELEELLKLYEGGITSILSQTRLEDMCTDTLALTRNMEVDGSTQQAEMIKELFELCMHIPGRPVKIIPSKEEDVWTYTVTVDYVAHNYPLTISDVLDPNCQNFSMQGHEVSVNGVLLSPEVRVAQFLKKYNIDTIAAALQFRGNPIAQPKDAAILNLLGAHGLIASISADAAASRVTISRVLHLLLLTSLRIKKTVTDFADLEYMSGKDDNNNLAHEIRQYQPAEMLMYMLSWPMALKKSKEHLKDVAFEIMMCLRYRKQQSDAKVARYYFFAKALKLSARSKVSCVVPSEVAGRAQVVNGLSHSRITIASSDKSQKDFTVVLPYGSKPAIKDGEVVEKGQNLASWDHIEDASYRDLIQRLALIDTANSQDKLNEYIVRQYNVETIYTIFEMSDAAILVKFLNEILPGQEHDKILAYADMQAEKKDRSQLPQRSSFGEYLVAMEALEKQNSKLARLQQYKSNVDMVDAKICEEVKKLTDAEPGVGVPPTLSELYEHLKNRFALGIYGDPQKATWRDLRDKTDKRTERLSSAVLAVRVTKYFLEQDMSDGNALTELFFKQASIDVPAFESVLQYMAEKIKEKKDSIGILFGFVLDNKRVGEVNQSCLKVLSLLPPENTQEVFEGYAAKGFHLQLTLAKFYDVVYNKIADFFSNPSEALLPKVTSILKGWSGQYQNALADALKNGRPSKWKNVDEPEIVWTGNHTFWRQLSGILMKSLDQASPLSAFYVLEILVGLQKMGLREPYQDRRTNRRGTQWFIKAKASGYIPYLFSAYMVSSCKAMPHYQEMVASQEYKDYCAIAEASTTRPY